MPTKLAVISCKARKKSYKCCAEEMYEPSQLHRAQVAFIKKYYDAYIILSAKHGVVLPNQMIKPYSIMLYTSNVSRYSKLPHIMSREETMEWGKQIMTHPIFTQYDHIDFHLANTYWKTIKNTVPNVCKSWSHISFCQSIFTVAKRYEELLKDFEAGKSVNLFYIGEKIISKYPYKKRCYYHPEYEPFFGWASDLVKKYLQQKLDVICLNRIDKTSITGERHPSACRHHKGWCCSKQVLKHLYKNEKGIWRYKKRSGINSCVEKDARN